MKDGIKNTLVVIGFVILVLFISFCSCMTITSFRNKVYDILDVVSEKQANEKFEEYIGQINKLNDEKQNYINQIAMLNKTNLAQANKIKIYEEKINDLNKQIVELTNKLSNISKNIDDVTVTYVCSYNNISYAIFDDNNNYIYHTGDIETKYSNNQVTKRDLVSIINEKQKIVDAILPKSVNSIYETCSHLYDFYEISIQNQTFGIDILHNDTYYFTQNTNLATKITFDDTEILSDDLSNLINDVDMYNYNVKYNYSVNANNQITDFTINVIINSI